MKYGDIVVYNDVIGKVVSDDKTASFRFLPCCYGSYDPTLLAIITEENTREATHEEKVQLIEKEYTWGEVVKVHCIGEYQIVEAIGKKNGERHWHTYIDFQDTHFTYNSLDSALLNCICIKYEGINSKAAMYFCRMIGMK